MYENAFRFLLMHLCIAEDTAYKNFLPLAYFRPVYDLRAGTMSLREKIRLLMPREPVALVLRPALAALARAEDPGTKLNMAPDDDFWCVNGRVLASEGLKNFFQKKPRQATAFVAHGAVAAVYVPRREASRFSGAFTDGLFPGHMAEGLPVEEFPGTMVNYPWDLVHLTAQEIERDFARLTPSRRKVLGRVAPGAHLVRKSRIAVGEGSSVKPGAVLDAEGGPVILGRGVTVMPNAVIEGPAFVGDHTTVKIGAKLYHGTSIGKWCKVGGEVESSILEPYSNKQHEGFLGHSYLGSWVNLGADTNTSDLKNTYGTVRVQLGQERIDTGLQFVGLTMGDHSKSGINAMFDTGSIVGVSCNLYGAGLLPKFVPSFTWGGQEKFETYSLERGLETARRVMARRNVHMSPAYEGLFRSIFEDTRRERESAGFPPG